MKDKNWIDSMKKSQRHPAVLQPVSENPEKEPLRLHRK